MSAAHPEPTNKSNIGGRYWEGSMVFGKFIEAPVRVVPVEESICVPEFKPPILSLPGSLRHFKLSFERLHYLHHSGGGYRKDINADIKLSDLRQMTNISMQSLHPRM